MRNRPLALLTVVLLLWTSLSPALAVERRPAPVAAVVGFRTSGDLVERQSLDYLVKRLAKSKRLLMVSESEIEKQLAAVWRSEQTPAKASLEQAYKRYVEGRKLYEKLEIESAILAFDDAVRGYREGIAALRENRYLLASHLYLGMALLVLGRQREGTEYLRQMIILDPSRETQQLPAREFPPKIVNLHKNLTAGVVRGPMGSVTIRSTPPGATVYFDGVQQNPTPVNLERVPAGDHFVLVEKLGYRRYSSRVEVKPEETRLEPVLEKWDPLAPQSFDVRSNPDVNSYLVNVGKALGTKILVLGEVAPGSGDELLLRGQVYDVAAHEFSKIEEVGISRGKIRKGSEGLSDKLLEDITIGGGVVAWLNVPGSISNASSTAFSRPVSSSKTESRGSDKAFYQQWWFWPAVGVLVLGAGAGVYLGMKSGGGGGNSLVIDNPLP